MRFSAAAFKAGKIQNNPFGGQTSTTGGVAIPPPANLQSGREYFSFPFTFFAFSFWLSMSVSPLPNAWHCCAMWWTGCIAHYAVKSVQFFFFCVHHFIISDFVITMRHTLARTCNSCQLKLWWVSSDVKLLLYHHSTDCECEMCRRHWLFFC